MNKQHFHPFAFLRQKTPKRKHFFFFARFYPQKICDDSQKAC